MSEIGLDWSVIETNKGLIISYIGAHNMESYLYPIEDFSKRIGLYLSFESFGFSNDKVEVCIKDLTGNGDST